MSSLTSEALSNNSKPAKNALLEVRITQEQKELLLAAAQIAGCSLTDFVVTRVLEAAKQQITEQEIMRLSQRDCEFFVAALLDPPTPSDRLRSKAIRHQQRMG
jgi:uncharacterized protein (DUF1778 family)